MLIAAQVAGVGSKLAEWPARPTGGDGSERWRKLWPLPRPASRLPAPALRLASLLQTAAAGCCCDLLPQSAARWLSQLQLCFAAAASALVSASKRGAAKQWASPSLLSLLHGESAVTCWNLPFARYWGRPSFRAAIYRMLQLQLVLRSPARRH